MIPALGEHEFWIWESDKRNGTLMCGYLSAYLAVQDWTAKEEFSVQGFRRVTVMDSKGVEREYDVFGRMAMTFDIEEVNL
jgi:hypothetical protein